MKNVQLVVLFMLILASSCKVVHSVTTIKPNDRFELGNNKHGSFKANLTNISTKDIEVYLAPIDGGKHSGQTVKPGQQVRVKVDPNTALMIGNNTSDTVMVKLKVTGDVGLSMGYKN